MTDESLPALPDLIRGLPLDEGPFEAFRVDGKECKVLVATYPASSAIEPHRHEDTEIVGVIVAGLVHLTIDGAEAAYGPGAWFHVPVAAEHSARYESTTVEVEFMFSR
jgi:quercetin dioxygenase-like cupin family protein